MWLRRPKCWGKGHRSGLLAAVSALAALAGPGFASTVLSGDQPEPLAAPVRIAQMPGGKLVVSDYSANSVFVVGMSDLALKKRISVAGHPVAVASGFGKIFVGNETMGRVEVYNPSGQFLYTLAGNGSIRLPNSIAVNELTEQVLVLDAHEKVIKVFAVDGTYLYPLTLPGALVNPMAMTLDVARGVLLVSDYGSFSSSLFRRPQPLIRLFDLTGNPLRTITGSFARPQGLTVDSAGRLYVVDCLEGEVQVLDLISGQRLKKLGGFGSEPGQLSFPLDVVVSEEAQLVFVTDNRNARIATFAQE